MKVRKNWGTSSLGERVQWALIHKHTGVNETLEAGGPTGGSVSKLSKRKEKVAGNAANLLKLAQALDVSAAWLAFGIGQPVDDDEPLLPNREVAAKLCREYGISEAAISRVLTELVVAEVDPPVLVWVERMRLADAEIRCARKSQ